MNQFVFGILDLRPARGLEINFVIGSLQQSIYLLCPNYLSNSAHWVLSLIRPELVCFKNTDKWTYFSYLVLIIIVLDKITLSMIILRKSKNQHFQSYATIYHQMFVIYLYQPLSTFCIQVIIVAFDRLHYGYIGFGLFLFCILQIEVILRFQFYQTVTLKIQSFERLVIGSLEYLDLLLILLQMIVYTITNNKLENILQFLITITIVFIKIYQQVTFRSYIRNDHIMINITCISITLSLALGMICNSGIYAILAFPLMFTLFYNKVQNEIDKILLNPQSSQMILLNVIYAINNPQMNRMRKSMIRIFHLKKCIDESCLCQVQQVYTDDAPLTLKMIEEYQLNQIEKLALLQQTPYTVYWFPSLLLQLGYPSQALKEIHRFLNNLPYRQQYNNLNRSQTSLVKSLDSSSKQVSQYQEQQKSRVFIHLSIFERAIGEYLRQLVLVQIQKGFKVQEGSVIVLAAQQFHQNETNTIKFQNDVIEIIIERMKFYQSLISDKSIQGIYDQSQALSKSIDILEKQLKLYFEHYPTKRNQSLLCFYQAEILTNILDAYKNQNSSSLQEDRIISLANNTKINLFQNNISYVQCVMNDDMQKLEITQYGTNLQANYPSISQVTFNKIVPKYIKEHHSILVQLFLSEGKSRFYYSFDQSFIQVDELFVEPMNMCVTNVLNSKNLEFLVFIQNLQSNVAYIIVDFDGIIQNYTIGFFEQMNYSNETIKIMKSHGNLFRFEIYNIIAKFDRLKDSSLDLNTEFKFIKEQSIYSYCSTKEFQNSMFQSYSCNLKIDRREIFEIFYYIIEVSSIQSFVDNSIAGTINTDQSPSFSEIGAQKLHLFSPKLIQNYLNQQSPKLEICINSPNNSHQGLVLEQVIFDNNGDNGIQIGEIQQNFFNDSNLLVNQSDSKIEMKSQSVKQQQVDMINDISSNDSRRTGFRKSIFYSKLTTNNKSNKINIALYSHTFGLHIYSTILIILSQTDISKFSSEINIIGYHADIMGPQDIYYIKRVTITTYQLYQNSGVINGSQYTALTDPCYADIMTAYKEMLEGFYEIFSNAQIQSFIVGNIVPVIFMKFDQSSIYNISMSQSEEYYVVLQYVYSLTKMFMRKQSATYSPSSISQKANYYNQHNQLEAITVQLKEFSINRASTVAYKWQFILISFLIFGFFINIFIMHLYNEYLKKHDKYLNLLFLLNNSAIQIEIEKQKHLLRSLQNNKVIFQNYDFIYRNLDNNLNTYKQQITNVKQNRQQCSLSRLKGYLAILAIFSLFVVYAVISDQLIQSYLTKYKSTTGFYKLIQDLKYASGNVYGYREQAFRWYQMPFYTQAYWEANNHLIDNSLNFMSQFMALQSSIQFSDYLVNQSFIDYFNELKSASLCSKLDPQYLVFLNRYCNISFSGVLQTGLTQSLNYIINAIQTQRQINNFTTRIEYNFYELEGSQIISRTFQTMSDYYKEILLSITNYNISQVQILSIVCIVISLAIMAFLYLYLFQYLRYSYYLSKRALYLFPQNVLLTDDMLERQLRILAINIH